MSSFTTPLVLEALDEEQRGRGLFVTYLPFSYDIGYKGSGDTVCVPVGFKTDLASIPWFARAFIPLAGRAAKPALLHDYLLIQGDPRALAVFCEAMEVAGVPPLRRCCMAVAVKLWCTLVRR